MERPVTGKGSSASFGRRPARERAVDRLRGRGYAGKRPFYPAIAVLIATVVAIGFGPSVEPKLLHPSVRPPAILYLHTAVFCGWVALFGAQVATVQIRRLDWHRRLGRLGLALGAILPVVGCATAVVLGRLKLAHGDQDAPAFLIISLNDMTTFAIAFWLAVRWRRSPEIHRRLMLVATAALTVAAFARFPSFLAPNPYWYAGVDLIIALGVVRDLVVMRQAHRAYLVAGPLVLAGQLAAMAIYLTGFPPWLAFARWLLA